MAVNTLCSKNVTFLVFHFVVQHQYGRHDFERFHSGLIIEVVIFSSYDVHILTNQILVFLSLIKINQNVNVVTNIDGLTVKHEIMIYLKSVTLCLRFSPVPNKKRSSLFYCSGCDCVAYSCALVWWFARNIMHTILLKKVFCKLFNLLHKSLCESLKTLVVNI